MCCSSWENVISQSLIFQWPHSPHSVMILYVFRCFSMLQLNAFAALSPLDYGSQHQLSLAAPHTVRQRFEWFQSSSNMFKRSVPGWRAEGDCLRWESFEAFHLLGQGPALGHAKTKKRPARLARLARLASTLRRMLQTSAQDDVPGYARNKTLSCLSDSTSILDLQWP